MGVQGLWKLLESAGKTAPLETMSNKVLAVDISIWLNQVIKAIRNSDGHRIPNSHIIVVYKRICKLLYYRVKPIIVFDGKVPLIKLRTCANRRQVKQKAGRLAVRQNQDRLKLCLQKIALSHVTGKPADSVSLPIKKKSEKDMFYLEENPNLDTTEIRNQSEHDDNIISDDDEKLHFIPLKSKKHFHRQTEIDPLSEDFKSLPPKVQYELLLDHMEYVKYAAKASPCPKGSSSNFSSYQIQNVINKNNLNQRLRELRVILNAPHPGDKQDDHHIQIMKAGIDSEIIFTKEINNTSYDIVNTAQKASLKNVTQPSETKAEISNNEDSEQSETKKETIKKIFFGSDTESDKNSSSDSSDSEVVLNQPKKVTTNVLGLACGHPGSFLNPYLVKSSVPGDKDSSLDAINIKIESVKDYNDVYELSSSDSDFDIVDEKTELQKDIKLDLNLNSSVSQSLTIPKEKILTPDYASKQEFVFTAFSTENENTVSKEYRTKTDDIPDIQSINGTKISPESEMQENEVILTDTPETFGEQTVTVDKMEESKEDNTESMDETTVEKSSCNQEPVHEIIERIKKGADLTEVNKELDDEIVSLKEKHRKNMSISDTVNDAIIADIKELLQVFGIPYLDAPGEAEAQCAELCNLSLCDGVITNDSDIFLFGNVSVYKDVFKRDKDVQFLSSSIIQQEFGLSRPRLIELAQLVGSDYCVGVHGIGGVSALEILSRYNSLSEFLSKFHSKDVDKKYLKFDFSNLPDLAATDAYMKPSVCSSKETFSWANLDINLIKDYTANKLNWQGIKVDETVGPILKVLDECSIQRPISDFYQVQISPSKRVQTALSKLKKCSTKTQKTQSKAGRGQKRNVKVKKPAKSKKIKSYVSSEDSD